MEPTCVVITNGNVFSMIALADWIVHHGTVIKKVYVTRRLPSSKGNVRGVLHMLWTSGWTYTYFKIWANKILPMKLRLRRLPASVKDFLRLCGLTCPVEAVDSVNTKEVVSQIKALGPECLVSFSATQRFKEPLITATRDAAINVHYGALPAYAGLSPYFWHLFNGEDCFGVTLHRIVLKLDAGPVIEQKKGHVEGARSALELMLRMAAEVSPMLRRFFEGQTGLADARPQDPTGGSYFGHPTRAQMRQFHRRGMRMTDAPSRAATIQRIRELAEAAERS